MASSEYLEDAGEFTSVRPPTYSPETGWQEMKVCTGKDTTGRMEPLDGPRMSIGLYPNQLGLRREFDTGGMSSWLNPGRQSSIGLTIGNNQLAELGKSLI